MPAAAIAVIAAVALLVAASLHITVRTASADAPNQFTIVSVRPGHGVCEGPLTSQGTARAVGIWGAAAGGSPEALTVTVKDAATHATLASGSLRAVAAEREWTIRLDRDVPEGRPVHVCLDAQSGSFSLAGSVSSDNHVSETGIRSGERFSLVLLSDGSQSLLGSLPLAFSRASLWRFSWVGPWTFWLLAVALLMAFGLIVAAVIDATGEDGPSSPSAPEDPPLPGRPSEAREDRSQPVP